MITARPLPLSGADYDAAKALYDHLKVRLIRQERTGRHSGGDCFTLD